MQREHGTDGGDDNLMYLPWADLDLDQCKVFVKVSGRSQIVPARVWTPDENETKKCLFLRVVLLTFWAGAISGFLHSSIELLVRK